jgi:Ca2+-binding RTX toxin-like protein
MSKTTRAALLTLAGAAAVSLAAVTLPADAAPVPAASGTVTVRMFLLEYRAGAGVSNAVHLISTKDGYVSLHDDNAPVTLGPAAQYRCLQVDPSTVRCPGGIYAAILDLGDRNDSLTAQGFATLGARGGPGDDRLDASMSEEHVNLTGDQGNDELYGGSSEDVLDTGPGSHQKAVGNAGEDVCTGADTTRTFCEP